MFLASSLPLALTPRPLRPLKTAQNQPRTIVADRWAPSPSSQRCPLSACPDGEWRQRAPLLFANSNTSRSYSSAVGRCLQSIRHRFGRDPKFGIGVGVYDESCCLSFLSSQRRHHSSSRQPHLLGGGAVVCDLVRMHLVNLLDVGHGMAARYAELAKMGGVPNCYKPQPVV
jgi:hypothetical protein